MSTPTTHHFMCNTVHRCEDWKRWVERDVYIPDLPTFRLKTTHFYDEEALITCIEVDGTESTLVIESNVVSTDGVSKEYPLYLFTAQIHLLKEHLIPLALSHLDEQDRQEYGSLLKGIGEEDGPTFGSMGLKVTLKERPPLSRAMKDVGTEGESAWIVEGQDDYKGTRGSVDIWKNAYASQ